MTLAPVFAALADETRWGILTALGSSELSASSLAARLPVSRQAIAKHLVALEAVGLVDAVRVGREVRYRAVGTRLSAVGRELDAIGTSWDERLTSLKRVAEEL
jgi:DNA-binding transcriptional ArsR family regulator